MRLSLLSSAAFVSVVAACSGSSSTSPQQACADLASSICNKLQSCVPYGLTVTYGDVATCTQRAALNCPAAFSAPGSGANAANVEACAQAYASESCTALLDNGTPSACMVSGTLAAGSPCGDGVQCSGTNAYCKVTTGSCGVCSNRSAPGGACTVSNDCQAGLACVLGTGGTGSCVTPAAQGAACSATQPCHGSLTCVNGVCATPLAAGAACPAAANANACNGDEGYYCSAAGVCALVQTAAVGGACGVSGSGITECAKGTCKLAAASATGTCEAFAADGAACDLTNGPQCLSPASCVNSVCTVPNTANCK